MRVRYTPRARRDLADVVAYLDDRSPTGARNVEQAIRTTIALIAHFPEIGQMSGEGDTRVMVAGRYPYLIYWRVMANQVDLLHIRHASRERP